MRELPMRTAWIKQLAIVMLAAALAIVTRTSPAVATSDRSFVAVSPARLLDTRPGQPTIDGTGAGAGLVAAGGTITVSVSGRGGVPATGVAAVVVNVTAVDPRGGGFVTVFASGTAQPVASNLNVTAGQIVPNLVTAAVGPDGRLALFASTTTHLIVDVMGWFPTGGTFTPTAPSRLLDTRPGQPTVDGRSAGSGALGAGGSIRVPVTGRGGVPARGAGAVVVNVTAVEPYAGGFVTVFAAGGPRPLASNLNVVPSGIVPNLVIVSIGADGQIELFGSASTHLVVDVLGWFPADGAFHGTSPSRLLDTRPGQPTIDGLAEGAGQTSSGVPMRVRVTGRGGVPASGVGSVVVNVTSTDARGAGFVSVYASGAPRPTASNLNVVAGQIVPNLVITAIGSDGRIELYASSPMHLIVDVMGWFPPDAASPPPPPAPADELWVVAGATAGGNGSTTRPFATLQAALDVAAPGNTIRLAAGDHRGKARTIRAGTEAAPIRIVGSAGARLRHDGTSRLLEIDHSNITVEDLDHSLEHCQRLGGSVVAPPRSYGGGRYCVIKDPAGAVCALYQPPDAA